MRVSRRPSAAASTPTRDALPGEALARRLDQGGARGSAQLGGGLEPAHEAICEIVDGAGPSSNESSSRASGGTARASVARHLGQSRVARR